MTDIALDTASAGTTPLPLRGLWWRPEDPENRIGGTLEIIHGRGGSLELDGGFLGEAAPAQPVIIHGNSAGKAVTIGEAQYRGRSVSRDTKSGEETITRESWTCFEIFTGFHAALGSKQRFDTFSLQTANLGLWVNKPRPESSYGDDGSIVLKVEIPQAVSAEVPELGTLTIWWSESSSFGGQSAQIRVVPTFELRSFEPMTNDEAWARLVTPVLLFTTFVLGSPDRLTSLKGFVGDLNQPDGLQNADFFLTAWADAAPKPRARWVGEHLLQFSEVEQRFDEVIPAWFQLVSASRESFLDFFARSITPFLYAEEEFSRIVRAMESWHRAAVGGTHMSETEFQEVLKNIEMALSEEQWKFIEMRLRHANERTLKQRLDALLADAGEPVAPLVASYKSFNRKVVNTRNKLAHEGAIGEDFSEIELFWATKTLAHIFQSVLLRRLGFPPDEVKRFELRSADWRWLSSPGNPLADWSKYTPPVS
ncbi:MAG: HEPN domain-containing protein [Jatrophihabitantaceae bacterium]